MIDKMKKIPGKQWLSVLTRRWRTGGPLNESVPLQKAQHHPIEGCRIFETASMPGAEDHMMFGAGDFRAHFSTALERVVELAVHD